MKKNEPESSLQGCFNGALGEWSRRVPFYSTSPTWSETLVLEPSAGGDTDTTHHSSPSLQTLSSAEWGDWERKAKWVKERNKQGRREECSMVTRPLEAREHILDSTFSWRGLERRNKRLLACQRRTAMHLNREDEDGKGEILWWIPLFSARTHALEWQTLWLHPVPLAYGSVPCHFDWISLQFVLNCKLSLAERANRCSQVSL